MQANKIVLAVAMGAMLALTPVGGTFAHRAPRPGPIPTTHCSLLTCPNLRTQRNPGVLTGGRCLVRAPLGARGPFKACVLSSGHPRVSFGTGAK